MSPLGALPRLSRSARRALVAGALLSALTAVALIAQAWALGHGLAAVVTEGAGPDELIGELTVLTGAILARAVLGWATEAVSARAAAGAKEELRALLLDSALHRGPEWIRRYGPAELTAVTTKGLDSLDAYFTKYLPALVTAAVVPPAAGLWILLSDWISAVIVLVTVPLIPLFAWLVGVYTERRTARAADSVQRLSGRLLELVRALPVLAAFGRARAQGDVVRRVSEQHRRSTNATLRIAFLSALVLELLSSLSVAVVAVGIGVRLVHGDLDLATGLLVLVLAPECYLPLRAAGAAHHASEDGVEAVRRVDEVVLRDRAEPGGGVEPPETGDLRVRGLRVPRGSGPAPDGLSFTARGGHVLRLDGFDGIGPSGSGKSTVMAVLLGFAEPDSGRITWGEHDVRAFDPGAWRGRVAWIPQHPTFTGGTVADELHIAGTDQPDLAEHVPAVLAEAAAEHLLHRRVDGLSTGERQRVAVARALLRLRGRARLLLADEPTAHLDGATAHRVTAALERAAADGAAVVLASHRPGGTEAEPAEAREPGVGSTPELPAVRGRIRDLITRRGMLGYALGALSLLSGLALTAASAYLIARASQQPPILTLTVVTVGVRAFALSRAVLRYAERLVTHDDAFRLSGRLRAGLWDALVRLGPVRSAGLRRGEGVRRLVDDADTVRDLVPRVLFPPIVGAVVLIGAVVVQALVLPEAGMVLAVAVLLSCVAGPAAALLAERRASAAVTEGRRQVAGQVLALLDGAAELLAFGAARTRRAELAEQDRRLVHRSRRAAFAEGAATAVNTALMGVAIIAGVWLGAIAVADGRLAPELAPLLGLLPLAAAEAVALLPPAAQQWTSLRAAHDRLAPLLAAPDEQQEPPAESDRVELVDAHVRWPGAELPALRGVDLALPPGAHVAVLGPSGGGKSTLLDALLGALPVEGGRIARPHPVAWCPQEPQLVSTTVRENLRLANPHAEDTELVEALRLTGLPGWRDRLDAQVGSAGAALSGGEAQRLALARALLVPDAQLYLLDEPTAHLDEPTAAELLDRLAHRLRDRTVVHVTHRWSETHHADVVLRVVDGHLRVVRAPAREDAPSSVC